MPGAIKPLQNLKKADLENEIWKRGIRNQVKGTNASDLQAALDEHLKGVARVPALSACNPEISLKDLLLESYEIVPCELLHDVKGEYKTMIYDLYDRKLCYN